MRMEDPFNRQYRYPVARWIVRALVRTPVTPNQVTLVQPLFAALAGYLVTFDDPRALVAGALVFELRSILDCVDGALARAKSTASPAAHAIGALADWLGVTFLYAGIFWHVHLHPPPGGPWSAVVAADAPAAARGEQDRPHRRASAAKRAASSGGVSATRPMPFTVPPSTRARTMTGPGCTSATRSDASNASTASARCVAR